MSNPYIEYYTQQAGTGLSAFQGVRYQRGHGFFGRLFSGIGNFVKGLAPNLFKKTLPTAIGFAQDVIEGQNVGQSAKNRLIQAGKVAANETLDHIKTKIQGGSGIPRRRKRRRRMKSYSSGRNNKRRRKSKRR